MRRLRLCARGRCRPQQLRARQVSPQHSPGRSSPSAHAAASQPARRAARCRSAEPNSLRLQQQQRRLYAACRSAPRSISRDRPLRPSRVPACVSPGSSPAPLPRPASAGSRPAPAPSTAPSDTATTCARPARLISTHDSLPPTTTPSVIPAVPSRLTPTCPRLSVDRLSTTARSSG